MTLRETGYGKVSKDFRLIKFAGTFARWTRNYMSHFIVDKSWEKAVESQE